MVGKQVTEWNGGIYDRDPAQAKDYTYCSLETDTLVLLAIQVTQVVERVR